LTALRFDVDSEGAGAAWIEAELPAPNLVVVNPENGHAHLIYQLGAWVRTDFGDPSRLRVVRYAAAIERAYAAALGADRAYTGRFHHNPFSDAYVTKIGRQAPYSLAELAQYVDLNSPTAKAVAPQGIGRNVEIFDRLRRWAYTAVADWKIGTREAWDRVVSERAAQIAGDVGADSPRGPLPENEVGHIVKSVARWVWERYTAGTPPLLREEHIARRRARERARQAAREAERARSKQTRAEYLARAQQRRIEAAQLRTRGLSLRAIGRALACSVAEVHRLLLSVQGSPVPSDFEGVRGPEREQRDARSRRPQRLSFIKPPPAIRDGVDVDDHLRSRPSPRAFPCDHGSDAVEPDRDNRQGRSDELSRSRPAYEGVLGYIQRRIREIVTERAKDG
jgi:AraC-like DNA-binding protein